MTHQSFIIQGVHYYGDEHSSAIVIKDDGESSAAILVTDEKIVLRDFTMLVGSERRIWERFVRVRNSLRRMVHVLGWPLRKIRSFFS